MGFSDVLISRGNDLEAGVMEAAKELGMDPLVLGTIISYETAGTLDPRQDGPTTQHGQHRGLIQFGEPQARDHKVDFTSNASALSSQLGSKGSIVDYFRKNGWKEGMSELEAYSIVNTGNPFGAHKTDENNGGAAGTVKEKVEGENWAGHRKKAFKYIFDGQTPSLEPDHGYDEEKLQTRNHSYDEEKPQYKPQPHGYGFEEKDNEDISKEMAIGQQAANPTPYADRDYSGRNYSQYMMQGNFTNNAQIKSGGFSQRV